MLVCLALATPTQGEELSALARLQPETSAFRASGQGVELSIAISQPVPWRLRFLDNPPRLIIDAREVDWAGIDDLTLPEAIRALRAGSFRPGWSRLVIELSGPYRLQASEMRT
ncbi:MAG: N-acetylmuramoyl-L-alanine amidase, partial [Rhodobacterales bacterium 12-65-15]